MTTVLVVNHDIDIADEQASSLRRLGYQVTQCSGPAAWTCPVLRGQACSWVASADVLLYDVWATGERNGARDVIEGLRELYPNIPIVLAAPGMELSWVETSGRHGITPLVGKVNGPSLGAAMEAALGTQTSQIAVAS